MLVSYVFLKLDFGRVLLLLVNRRDISPALSLARERVAS